MFCLSSGAWWPVIAALVIGTSPAQALAAPHAGHGPGGGGATQVTDGRNTANAPAIVSAVRQLASGRRTVNAPAGNNGVASVGVQQETSVSGFTNTLSGRCVAGIDDCGINQSMRAGGGGRRGGRHNAR